MRIVCCSSGCCAIKHIRDFEDDPTTMVTLYPSEGHNEDQCSTIPYFGDWQEVTNLIRAPGHEILGLLVAQIKDRRPAGMITANLVCRHDDEDATDFVGAEYIASAAITDVEETPADAWRPYFEKLGFTEQQFLNSNSGNTISHFTLVYGEN